MIVAGLERLAEVGAVPKEGDGRGPAAGVDVGPEAGVEGNLQGQLNSTPQGLPSES